MTSQVSKLWFLLPPSFGILFEFSYCIHFFPEFSVVFLCVCMVIHCCLNSVLFCYIWGFSWSFALCLAMVSDIHGKSTECLGSPCFSKQFFQCSPHPLKEQLHKLMHIYSGRRDVFILAGLGWGFAFECSPPLQSFVHFTLY